MKNPLIRRLPRELKSDAGKYLIIFTFMIILIGFVSGFLVASGSLMKIYNESFEKYNIEDGNFEFYFEADETTLEKIETDGDIRIYENFYIECETGEVDSTLRIYKKREEINKICIHEGKLPANINEIAIDRMYADNNSLEVGDSLTVDGKKLKITALVALSDYSALYENPSDMMFDAIKFGVAVMNDNGFNEMDKTDFHYNYSWKYNNPPADDDEAKKMSEELLEIISSNGIITEYIPMYINQAIRFVGEDTGNDRVSITAFMYLVIAILAFIMAITTNNTIAKESTVIGTLRASGYTRGEILRHYIAMPMLVVIVSAIIGNILGYTVFEDIAKNIYYANYSVPVYKTEPSAEAFIKTTIVPAAIMFVINLAIISYKLRLSPLKFIRRDLKTRQRKKALKLSSRIGIMHRFRIRIILQNIPNYVTIVIGIFLANVIFLFGMGFPELLDTNSRLISENIISNYQYVLKVPIETDNTDAEKYCAGTLSTFGGKVKSERVTVYGLIPDSKYIDIDTEEGIYISEGYSQKFRVNKGDKITLKEEYGTKKFSFKVAGIYDNPTTIAVYMDKSFFNETFGYEADYFNGYLSDKKLDDINKLYVATIVTEDDMDKVGHQINHSLGGIFDMFYVFGIVMFMLIIYLLSKIVIEKNTQSISMTKILGYSNREIGGLYVVSTSIVVIISFILTMPLANIIMKYICVLVFSEFSGWIPYELSFSVFVKIIVSGIIAYSVIAFAQFRRVKKIPMDTALKNVE
ncbi:MAG: ABC transporter permease [Ruminococcus sp.]|nr:ABC transporter permease [Ruminococcus sp.]